MKMLRRLVLFFLVCALFSHPSPASPASPAKMKSAARSALTSGQAKCLKGFQALGHEKSQWHQRVASAISTQPQTCYQKALQIEGEQTSLPSECTQYRINDFPKGALNLKKLLNEEGTHSAEKTYQKDNAKMSQVFSESRASLIHDLYDQCEKPAKASGPQKSEKTTSEAKPGTHGEASNSGGAAH